MPLHFLSPLNLLAALAVALPVVIHLLRRKREATLLFPTVRFLILAQKRSSRRLRLRRLLLLLVRSLLLALFALVLARPVLYAPGAVFRAGEAGYTVVILDTSLSMAVRAGPGRRFDEARALAASFAARAGDRERFALVEAATLPGAVRYPGWLDRDGFLQALQAAAFRPAVADLSRSFTQAYQLLREAGAAQKRILVVTDLARGGWEQFSAGALGTFDAGVPVRIFHLDGGGVGNRAGVLALEARGESRVAGELREVTAEIVNFGPERVLPLELRLDGKLAGSRLETVAPGARGRAVFQIRPPAGGAYRCEVRLPADAYAEDDRRFLGLEVAPPVGVLLVDGEPGSSLIQSETFFLQEALDSNRIAGPVPVKVTVAGPESLTSAARDAYQVLVLANVRAPEPVVGGKIAEFVARGGGLAVFWGKNSDAEAYRSAFAGLMPAGVSGTAATPPEKPWRIGEIDYGADLLGVFRPPGGGTLATAAFTGRAMLTALSPAARVPARFADGAPWIVEQQVGRGRVLLFASTADLEWNDLATKPAFVPLVQRAVLLLAGSLAPGADREITAGEEKIFAAGAELVGSRIRIATPGGRGEEVEYRPQDAGASAVYRGTEAVGFYGWSGPAGEGVFAVNVPARESDLTPLAADDLENRLRPVRAEVVTIAPGHAAEENVRTGVRSLDRPLLTALLVLLLIEMLIAGPRRQLAAIRSWRRPRRAGA